MKRMKFQSVCALSVVSALLFVTACSSKNEAEPKPTPSGSSTAVAADPFGKYSTPIEVTTVRSIDPSVRFSGTDTIDNNAWTKLYQDQLGIKLKYKWIATSGDEMTQKMNVMIASDDLPDFLTVNNIQLKQLVEAGMVKDLTEVYEKYAAPLTKKFMNEDGPEQLNSAKFGGKLMAIPSTNSSMDGAPLLWVRTDWLKKLNLPEPKTMDDVMKISEAFTKQDPDGNVKADTFGLGLNKGIGGGGVMGLAGFFNGYHSYMGNWVKDASGKIVYGTILPETRTALLKLQELYKNGQLDREFGVKDGAKAGEDAVAGKIGMAYGAMWLPISPLQKGKDLDPKMEWRAFPIVSADSQPAQPQVGLPVGNYYVVRKDAKNPEALMKIINMFIEKGWGQTGEFDKYFNNKEGIEIHKYAIFNAWSSRKNLDVHLSVVEAFKTNNTSKLNPEQLSTYEKIKQFNAGDNKQWNQARVFGEDSSFKVINQYVNQKLLLMNAFFGAPTKTMGDKKATLDKMEQETITKIIMGEPIAAFDKFVEDWKKLGGNDITNEINEWAKSAK
jgi:putative aldouronate transport system substrate-binding protein